MEDLSVFSQRLTLLRADQQLSRKEFGEKSGILPMQIGKLEEGIESPSLRELVAIATTYSISVDYLIGLEHRKHIEVSDLTPEMVEIVRALCLETQGLCKRVRALSKLKDGEPLEEQGFSARIVNALTREGITNTAQLLLLPAGELKRIRNLGETSYQSILQWQEETRTANGLPNQQKDPPKPKREPRPKHKKRHRKHYIETIGLPNRTKGTLLKAGVRTKRSFLSLTEDEIDQIPSLGSKGKACIMLIQEKLKNEETKG